MTLGRSRPPPTRPPGGLLPAKSSGAERALARPLLPLLTRPGTSPRSGEDSRGVPLHLWLQGPTLGTPEGSSTGVWQGRDLGPGREERSPPIPPPATWPQKGPFLFQQDAESSKKMRNDFYESEQLFKDQKPEVRAARPL